MKSVKEQVVDALETIQEEENETIQEFHSNLKSLIAGLNARLEDLADKRLEVLTNIASPSPAGGSRTVSVEEDFKDMSLKEIAGVRKPVDESYQQNGTAAWPNFWLHALLGCAITRNRISSVDKQLLSYLRDIRCREKSTDEPGESFEIQLVFAENPFFGNKLMKRSFTIINNEVESESTPIEWKENAIELVEELSVADSDEEYEGQGIPSNHSGSFFDFFQPFEDVYFDLKVARAIKERILINPLKYAIRFENFKLNEKMEDSEPEDGEEVDKNASGGRYPFSWLISLATFRSLV